MKILHVTNYFRDTHKHVGGAEQACYRTALLASNHGYTVSVVTTRPDNSAASEFQSSSLDVIEDYLPAGLRQYVEAAKWYSVQYDPVSYRGFSAMLAKDRVDVVHFHNCQFLTLSLVSAARRAGRKTLASIYDYWLFCPTAMLVDPANRFCLKAHGTQCVDCLPPKLRTFQKLLLSFRRAVIDHYLSMIDGFHVLSEHSRSVLEGYGIPRERVHVVRLTLPSEFKTSSSSQETVEPDMILFAGWLNERKGLHRLLEAMPIVLNEHPSARLVAVGGEVRFGEGYRKKLEKIISVGGLRDRVEFTGHLHPSRMKELIQKAGLVVIPEQYENMSPLLMIEAMSLAKPIVISRAGGIPEFIEDGVSGFLAEPLDHRDFAAKILAVFNDRKSAREMGLRARERILTMCDDGKIWEDTRRMYEAVSN